MGGVCKTIIGVQLWCAAENGNNEKNDNVWWPIEKSRHVSLNIATKKYAFLRDIGFISSSNASTNNKYAFVIPEFKYVSSANDIINKTELIEEFEYKNKTATPFQMIQFKTGHCSANYSKWFNKETQNIERYDERLNEYGFKKIVHIKGLGVVDGHSFNVLNDRFILKLVEIKMQGKEANDTLFLYIFEVASN